MANVLSAAQKAARSAEMAKRAQALARAAELRAISSLGTRARVTGLARQAELDMKAKVSSNFVPDTRPPGLARIQEDLEFLRTNKPAGRPAPSYTGLSPKNKSDIGKVVKAVKTKDAARKSALSNTAKGSRGRKFYEGQKASKIKPKGSSSVGFRDEPLPGSAAAIPRGADVPMIDRLPGRQISTRSDFYKRRK